MTEELERTEITYTHTYDQFTVFFYGNHVFIGEKEYPLGQCCADVMNLDEAILNDIDRRVRAFIPAAKDLLMEKNGQHRRPCAGAAERCLGAHIFFAGLSGFENGRGVQLPHL